MPPIYKMIRIIIKDRGVIKITASISVGEFVLDLRKFREIIKTRGNLKEFMI
jgi:hypothetical protein